MIDIHTHITPCVDDGCESVEEALDALRAAEENGTEAVVLTSHYGFKSQYPEDTARQYKARLEAFVQLPEVQQLGVALYIGAEHFCDRHIFDKIRQGEIVPIGDTSYVLAEFAYSEHGDLIEQVTDAFLTAGYRVIIAHAERYETFFRRPEQIAHLRDKGVVIQVNGDSILGEGESHWNQLADWLLRREMIDVVASDTHDPYLRNPDLCVVHASISLKTSLDYADLVLQDNPQRIVHNEKVTRGGIQ